MFSSGPNYTKLKTNLRLALNRLKLLEKKKAELAQKARKEIADYLATGKTERAKIRVEHIIREDYLVEAMEIVEMYCDLLLARFGLVTQMKELDDGIAEAVYSLVWVSLRLQSDINELKVISEVFMQKYGPVFTERARTATGEHHVSEKLMHKLNIQAPPKLLVEKYLIEIAKNYNIEYEPDPQVMQEEKPSGNDNCLIDLSDRNNLSGGPPPPHVGFIGYPNMPQLPQMPDPPSTKPFNYPPPYGGGGGGGGSGGVAGGFSYSGPSPSGPPPFAYNIPPNPSNNSSEKKDLNINSDFLQQEKNTLQPDAPPPRYSSLDPYNLQNSSAPKPKPRSKNINGPSAPPSNMEMPNLPNVPADLPDVPNDGGKKSDDDDIDFDYLSRRFEELKKMK
ncbi:IST1 homolog isoform X2 [Episyrphus balteatus]|uniref:IST1 homolog isoform X2 n=1 Tax=Episyrphus balteatus TaxID=286459 RepID=UPI0024860119|nr:IST1 homolog isoform X2 [Episyrphus balteatus]